jgi:hypothetical protein
MKKILLLALLFQAFLITKAQLIYNPSVHSVAANPYLYLDIKTDFGALGNDSNDHEAFIAAASFINARGGHCQLNIPAGIYRVGKQTINGNIGWGNFHWIGQHVFALNNIDSVNIIGQFDLVTNKPTSILQYIDSLKYGVFNPATNLPYYSMAASTYNFDSVAHIGICVYLVNSTRVSIKNLLLDGNFYPGKMQLGGKFGDQGWQIDHVGFYVSGKCGSISINNCESNRFGKDGISISTLDTLIYSDTSVRLSNCKFIKNGRQAFSWEAGRNLYALNCNFDSTAFGEVPGSPGCGFDVEGDNGICANGYFNKCTFEQNAGAGFSAIIGNSAPYLVSGLYFDSCRLNRYAFTQYRPKTVFNDCEINGCTDGNYGSLIDSTEATRYNRCNFSDCLFTQQTYGNQSLGVPNSIQNFVISCSTGYDIYSCSQNSNNVHYANCNFSNYYNKLFSISNDLPIMPANHNIYLDTCTFSNYVKIDDFINGYNLFYKSCMFNIPGTGSPLQSGCYYIWGTEPSQNTLINPIYNFWDCSGTPPQCTAPLIEFISTHTTCNTYNISANVHGVFGNLRYLWSNGATTSSISNVAAGTYSVKIWNHLYYTLLDSITITNPPALTATTILSDVSCATASDGSIQLTATGGTPGYTYNWSNAATTQNLTNLSAGSYSCTVTDANGCNTTVNNLTINAPSGAYCCNTNFTNAPTHLLADNISSSTLAQSTYSNTAIMVNGTFTIDNNLTLNNCQLYFTTNAKIDILNNYTLNIDGCTLQSGCGTYWDGIYADDITEQLNITNSTNISDMENGINISNNAKLICSNNTFLNNANYGIKLSNIITNTQFPIVNNNSFSSDANFIPYNTATKGAGGIDMLDCSDMTINQNNFSTLFNGINITASNTITNSITSNTIDLINNHFQDITFSNSPYYYLPNNNIPMNAYNDTKGCAINIDYSLAPTFDATTNITIATLDTTVNTIFNTTKAIVNHNSNVNIQNQTIKNTTFGILSSCMLYKNQNIDNNFIDNTHLGIQTLGGIGVTSVQNNIVKNCVAILDDVGAGITNAPTGIDIKNLQYVLGGGINQQINSNRVEIASETGIGIAELNSQTGNITSNNDIRFNTINAGTVYCYTKDLVGVHLTNCEAININANWISGINATIYNAAFTARQSKGIYFQDSKQNLIGCNNIKNTKQGLYAWGDNTTADGNITFNHIKNTNSPIYTYDGANMSNGTFGDIGNANTENGNDWVYQGIGASLLYGGWKIIRNSNDQTYTPDKITTNNSFLIANESGVIGTGNPYLVAANTNNNSDPCLPLLGSFFADPNTGTGDNTTIDLSTAHDVVNGDVDYINHATVAHWIDEKELYGKLDRDIILRNSDPILLSFYNTKHNQLLGKIRNADSALQSLLTNINANNIADLFNYANARNSEIQNGSDWEMNERNINDIFLQTIEIGFNNIDEEHKTFVQTLANSCPYVNGTAVYKARVLNALLQPNATYNDRVLCIPTSQYKMSNGNNNLPPNIDIDSLNETLAIAKFGANLYPNKEGSINIVETETTKQTIGDAYITPNPATNFINVYYNSATDATLEIYNILGETVTAVKLLKENSTHKLDIANVTNGIYTYKIITNNNKKTLGKLTICH